VLYVVTGLLAIGTAASARAESPADPYSVSLFGLIRLREASLAANPISDAGALFSIAATSFATATFGRSFARGRRSRMYAFLGAAIVAGTSMHDAVRDLGFVVGPYLSPFGYLVFVGGAVVLRLTHFTALRQELEARTRDLRRQSRELMRSYDE